MVINNLHQTVMNVANLPPGSPPPLNQLNLKKAETQQNGVFATFKNAFCGLFSALNPANWRIFSHGNNKGLGDFQVKQLSGEEVSKLSGDEKNKLINDQAQIINAKDKQIQELMNQIELLKKQSSGSNPESQIEQPVADEVIPPPPELDVTTINLQQKDPLGSISKVLAEKKGVKQQQGAKVGNNLNVPISFLEEIKQSAQKRSERVNFNPQSNKPKNVGEKEISQEDLAKQKLEKFLGNPIAKQAALMSLAENQSDKKALLKDLFKDIEKAVAEKKNEKLTKELAKIKDNIGQDVKIEQEEKNELQKQIAEKFKNTYDDDNIEDMDIKPEKLQEFYAKSFNDAKVMSLKSDVNSLISFLERNKISCDQK
jgi:hypothetical protein